MACIEELTLQPEITSLLAKQIRVVVTGGPHPTILAGFRQLTLPPGIARCQWDVSALSANIRAGAESLLETKRLLQLLLGIST